MNNNKNFQKFVGGLKTFGNNLVSNAKQNPLGAITSPKATFISTLAQTAGKPLTQKKPVAQTSVSNPSATNTTPTVIKPPASTTGSSTFQQGSPASTYMNTLSNNTYQQPTPTPTPTQAPTTAPIQQPQAPKNDAYSRYVSMLRGEDETAKKYLTNSESAMQRLADIQNETEQKDFGYRKLSEDRFVQPGGTTGGAREAISDISRKSNSELADLALRESAAARTANLSRSVYNDYINAGKSEYEAEQAQAEANKQEGFTLGKDQVRYDAQGNVIAGGMSGGSSEGNELLSPTEAQALGVPYGTTKAGAYGSTAEKPLTVDQAKARQFATAASNADELLATIDYTPGFLQLPAPNQIKSGERQSFEQASRAFVNAVLRRESGATITDDEFKNKFKELIPRAGDGEAVLAQKALARKSAVETIKQAGGGEYPTQQTAQNQVTQDEIEFLRSQGVSEEEIQSLSFNNVGNTRVSIPQSSRLAFVNNNPGNLRFVGQQGATQGENGFAKFSSPEAGVKALESQIKLDASRGLTLQQFINKYAPPTENNTNQYLAQMTQMLGVPPTTKISNVDIKRLTQAIALKESGTRFA